MPLELLTRHAGMAFRDLPIQSWKRVPEACPTSPPVGFFMNGEARIQWEKLPGNTSKPQPPELPVDPPLFGDAQKNIPLYLGGQSLGLGPFSRG